MTISKTGSTQFMKKIISIYFLISLAFVMQAQSFKVIGYLPYYRFHLIDEIQFDKLTHINLAFANPDMTGQLSLGGTDIDPIILAAHDEQVSVFLSLAGGALTSEWAAAWAHLIKPANRSDFIHNIINYSLQHDLDGIDLDLEWSHVDENYSGFALELHDSLAQHNLFFTAALPGTYRYPQISDEVLDAYDWINMMVYDLRGPWDPDNPGPHSPFSFALNAIDYWVSNGVEQSRLTLGMPFYGYDFSDPGNVRALTYAQIVNIDPANAYRDQTGQIYYNGIPTIETKTQLAIDELSGAMIWEMGQDKFDQYSLLSSIHNVVQNNISSVSRPKPVSLAVFPNPVFNELHIELSESILGTMTLLNINGSRVIQKEIIDESRIAINVDHLVNGFYVLHIQTKDEHMSMKVFKN